MRIRHTAFPWIRSKADREIQQIILEQGKSRRLAKGACVVPAGEFYPHIAIVMSGMLSKSFEVRESSKDQAMSIILPGAMLGDSFFMSRRASNLAVHALRESAIVEVSHEFIEKKMVSDPAFFRKMMNHFMLDMESDLEGLATLIARSHEECLKVLLKILVVRDKTQPDEEWYQLPTYLSHNEMSRIIYTTPLTVNRFLLAWKKQGLYFRKGNHRFLNHRLFENIYDWKHGEPA
ncbi:Crp/Fnr family transcriptional regulator [Geobacter sp. AOG2]|uniref:Crp/Fnr family transcriptional regulator n=1 Tax=Geobacter sp. AOG2 TaxID=1566347 RepID=UPI001CC33A5C|nr:Crp/Fnr family transcriptional regulator [Geobacter sp. AOG2]GFE59549.1 hypothetical protein AOG2_01370 [Geobacter sp. AOG2]